MEKWIKKFKDFFLDKINFCEPIDSKGNEKEWSRMYEIFSFLYWPIPQKHPCWCCAAVRTWIYAAVILLIILTVYLLW